MNDPQPVRLANRARERDERRQESARPSLPLPATGVGEAIQRAALDKRHDEEKRPRGRATAVQDADDVRMIQAGQHVRLAVEAPPVA